MLQHFTSIFMSADFEPPNIVTFISHYIQDEHLKHTIHYYENVIFAAIAALFVLVLFFIGTRKLTMVPGRIQNVLELIVEGLRDFFSGILGPKGKSYVPFLGVLFLYILSMNLMGLIPGLKSPTVDTNITFSLSISVFFLVQYTAISKLGPINYLDHIAAQPRNAFMWLMSICLLFPILFLTDVILPPFTLGIRLFGNITGEESVIAAMIDLGAKNGFAPLHIPFMFLSLILGTVQALVFSLLSTVYVLMVLPHDKAH